MSPMPYGEGKEVTCSSTPEARWSGGTATLLVAFSEWINDFGIKVPDMVLRSICRSRTRGWFGHSRTSRNLQYSKSLYAPTRRDGRTVRPGVDLHPDKASSPRGACRNLHRSTGGRGGVQKSQAECC